MYINSRPLCNVIHLHVCHKEGVLCMLDSVEHTQIRQ
jgi:hypothetical protein